MGNRLSARRSVPGVYGYRGKAKNGAQRRTAATEGIQATTEGDR